MVESAHVGATDLLEIVGRESGIDEDIRRSLEEGRANKVLAAARFWVSNSGSLSRIGKWQRTHPNPCETELTRPVYHRLFESLGEDANARHLFYKYRAGRAGESDVLAYDSTTLSTCSNCLKAARQGFNKVHDGLDTIKLLTLYSLKTRQPVAMTTQPGNIPDVISIQNALKGLSWLETGSIQVVTDNGCCSEANIARHVQAHVKFLTLIRIETSWIRSLLNENRDALKTQKSFCKRESDVHGICLPVQHLVSWKRKRTQNGLQKGEKMSKECRLYVYLYLDDGKAALKASQLSKKIDKVKDQIESGVTEFTPPSQKFIDKFLTVSKRGRGGRIKAVVNEEAFAEEIKNYGCFALVSNKVSSATDAPRYYRFREKIEEVFRVQKTNLDGERTRVWYDNNLKGRLFCQFVALGYWCFLRDLIRDVEDLASKKDPGESKEQEAVRSSLAAWLKNTSLVGVLDWFDCIELTRLKGKASNITIRTEMTKRDRLFFSLTKRVLAERKKASEVGTKTQDGEAPEESEASSSTLTSES